MFTSESEDSEFKTLDALGEAQGDPSPELGPLPCAAFPSTRKEKMFSYYRVVVTNVTQ